MFRRFAVMRHWRQVARIPYEKFLSPDELHLNDWSYGCIAKLLAGAIAEAVHPRDADRRHGALTSRFIRSGIIPRPSLAGSFRVSARWAKRRMAETGPARSWRAFNGSEAASCRTGRSGSGRSGARSAVGALCRRPGAAGLARSAARPDRLPRAREFPARPAGDGDRADRGAAAAHDRSHRRRGAGDRLRLYRAADGKPCAAATISRRPPIRKARPAGSTCSRA